jgi:hypothetical protein
MNCKENEPMIYVWNELTEEERVHLLKHLADCPACSRLYLETTQLQNKIGRVAADKTTVTNAAALTSRIMSAVHQQQKSETRNILSKIFPPLYVVRYSFALMSLLLLITFGTEYLYGIGRRSNESGNRGETVILSSSIIHPTKNDRKKKKSIFSVCRSPFTDQLTYLQCIKDQNSLIR